MLVQFQKAYEAATGERGPVKGIEPRAFIEYMVAHADHLDTLNHAKALAGKSVLLAYGSRDVLAPPELHQEPLARRLRELGARRLVDVVIESDHGFSDRRDALAETVVGWLRDHCSR